MQRSGFILITATAFLVFILYVYPYTRPFPFHDDWILVSHVSSPVADPWWLFTLHNDHRIPLQKLLHVFILSTNGIDFRALIFANACVALVIALLMGEACGLYRSRRHFGDLIIPLSVFNLGLNYFGWSFSFQFLSSNLFLAVFAYCAIRYGATEDRRALYAGLASLLLCSLCGSNGLIASSIVLTFLLLYWFYCFSHSKDRSLTLPLIVAAAILIFNMTLAALWKPSSASVIGEGFNFRQLAQFVFGIVQANLAVAGTQGIPWKAYLFLAVIFSAVFVCGKRIYSGHARERVVTISDVALLGVLTAILFTILAVAIARSGSQTWGSGWGTHYGPLTILLPIVAWMLISRENSRLLRATAGVLLLSLFAVSFLEGLRSRINSVASNHLRYAWVDSLVRNPLINPDLILRDYSLELGASEAEDFKAWLKTEILNLRRALPTSSASWAFAENPLLRSVVGRRLQLEPTPAPCIGNIDSVTVVDSESGYVRIRGWIYEPRSESSPRTLAVANSAGYMVGYAITGQDRPDVSKAIHRKAANSGFIGYLRQDFVGTKVLLIGESPGCQLETSPVVEL